MSMEFGALLQDTQLRNVTSLAINSLRKEAWVGAKDGSVRCYDLNSKIFKSRSREHSGVVVCILCWTSQKLMITVGVDGAVIFWSSGALATDKVYLGEPLFNAIIFGKKILVVATKYGCRSVPLDSHRTNGHYLRTDRAYTINAQKEFIRCLASQDGRLYSGGADGTFTIYEHGVQHGGDLQPVHIIRKAHAGGLTCIEPCRNFDEESWLVATGSVDHYIKIWTNDGHLVHVLGASESVITGLTYIRVCRQLWVASGHPLIAIIDPKTGENISEWTAAWQKLKLDDKRSKRKCVINQLAYSKELEILVAQTDFYYLLQWFFNPRGCILSIPCPTAIESIAFTKTEPVLFFTGDANGHVMKWEKAGFNTVKFSQEELVMQRKLRDAPVTWQTNPEPLEVFVANAVDRKHPTPSTYLPPKFYPGRKTDSHDPKLAVTENSPIQKTFWIDALDTLVVADERGVMYVWGYEETVVEPEEFAKHFAESARNDNAIISNIRAVPQFNSSRSALGSIDSSKTRPRLKYHPPSSVAIFEEDSTSTRNSGVEAKVRSAMGEWKSYKHYLNRASGLFCKFILWGHDACVSGMDYVYDAESNRHVLFSTGWDRRIISWNLQTGQVIDIARRDKSEPKVLDERETPSEYELVAEGQITDIAYSSARDAVAYSSRDAHIYVRKFSTEGRKMKLIKRWHAHNGEVLQVKWMELTGNWVSSGHDGTIRLWSGEDLGMRLALIHRTHLVQGLAMDQEHGWILAAVGPELQILDPNSLEVIQTHTGHQQDITGVAHVHKLFDEPAYVTSSYDATIQVWRACIQSKGPRE